MLFKLLVNRTTSSRTLFGTKTKKVEDEYLVSTESEQHLNEYSNRLPNEGIDIWTSIWGDDPQAWKEERTWEKVEGDDNDAHILLLKSPTGVVYEQQIKTIINKE